MSDENVQREEVKVTGEALVGAVRQLLHEGNIRRLTIKNDEGKTLIEIPLTIGVVGMLLLPVWAAIGDAALAADLTIVVEKVEGAKSRLRRRSRLRLSGDLKRKGHDNPVFMPGFARHENGFLDYRTELVCSLRDGGAHLGQLAHGSRASPERPR